MRLAGLSFQSSVRPTCRLEDFFILHQPQQSAGKGLLSTLQMGMYM
jgi:hypothetical protein